ncbi:MAG: class I SAM-dependent methyltransferase [Thermacetogeniaceae bacterium]
MLVSQVCKESDFSAEWFEAAKEKLYEPFEMIIRRHMELNHCHIKLPVIFHRKLWEHCYIYQALSELGLLTPGIRGLGFGVGREPLVSLFASCGCQITATDLDLENPQASTWADSNQHATDLDSLNEHGLCEPVVFKRLVTYENVDMNQIPDRYANMFDFAWSSCALEHCGSIELGKKFLFDQMKCLRPGGVAVHTTEYNLSSNERTMEQGTCVLFRHKDIEDIALRMRDLGHEIELDLDLGTETLNSRVDLPPYTYNPHLRLQLWDWACTSIGLVIKKGDSTSSWLQWGKAIPH